MPAVNMLRFVFSVLTKLVVKSALSAYFRCLLWLICLPPCLLVDILALFGMRVGLPAKLAYKVSITMSIVFTLYVFGYSLGWSTTSFSMQHCIVDNSHPCYLMYMCISHLCSFVYYALQVCPAAFYAVAETCPATFSQIAIHLLLLTIWMFL